MGLTYARAVELFGLAKEAARRRHESEDLPGGLGAFCPCGAYGNGPRGSVACMDLRALEHQEIDASWLQDVESFLRRYG